MLFGGLITVPFWEYRNLSAAYLDVMISDLPRVDYNTKEKETFTEEDQQEAMKRTKELQEKVKNGFFNKRLSLDNQKSIQSLLH